VWRQAVAGRFDLGGGQYRGDPTVPIEDVAGTVKALTQEGKFVRHPPLAGMTAGEWGHDDAAAKVPGSDTDGVLKGWGDGIPF